MDLGTVLTLFPVAAVAGDNFNRLMGISFGPKAFRGREGRFFNPRNLERTREFFDRYGTRAITFCRFIPFFRTFVPFVAGMTGMSWRTFLPYSVLGGVGWVVVCVLAGYFFGNMEFIRGHFELVLLTIITASALPAAAGYLKRISAGRTKPAGSDANMPPRKNVPAKAVAYLRAGVCRQIWYRHGLARTGVGACRRGIAAGAKAAFRLQMSKAHPFSRPGDPAVLGTVPRQQVNITRVKVIVAACTGRLIRCTTLNSRLETSGARQR
jgi:membrane protein DedA with SNARE-associated domain